MYRAHTVAVVVPAYNEAVLIRRVIETIRTTWISAFVVDDAKRGKVSPKMMESL